MKRIINAILCGVLFAGVFASAASAQPMGPGGPLPGNYPQSYFEGQGSYDGGYGGGTGAVRANLPGNFPEHLYLGFTGVDEGLGYEGSYFTLGGLFPFYHDGFDGAWYADDRLHVSENGGFFGNFGIGRRQKIGDTITGISLFYDYDDDQPDVFGHAFHQLSGAIQVGNPSYEFNFNGYLPISDTDHFYGTAAVPFVGHQMLIQPGIDVALAGIDSEFGIAIPGMEQWAAKAFAGYYFYDPLDENSPINGFGGGRLRFEFSPHHRVSFNLQVNHDEQFDTTGFLTVNYHLFGARHPAVSSPTLQPVMRNDHIVRVHQDFIVATNPRTGLAYNVQHVRNTAPAGGDGSIEMPFNNLTDTQNLTMVDDLIYVHATPITYQNTIQLQDRQFLIGSGPGNVTVPTVEVGDFLVPSLTETNPNLGNNLGPSVFLADDNLVGRINFTGQSGLFGTGINNASLISNSFQNHTLSGAVIQNSTGTFLLQYNNFVGAGVDGFRIANSTGSFHIFNNTFFGNVINGGHLLGTTGTAVIVGNNFGNNAQIPMPNGTGMRVVATSGIMNAIFTQNQVSANSVGAAFQSMNAGTLLNTTVTNNNFERNSSDALQFIAFSGSTSNINVFNERFVGNGTTGGAAIRVISTNVGAGPTSIVNASITDTFIDVGGGGVGAAAGISFSDTGNANFFATVNNIMVTDVIQQGSTGAGLNASFGNTNGNASLLTITNSSFTNISGAGMSFTAGGLGGVQITNVSASNNTTGISTTSASGVLDVHIDNSVFNNNTGDGMNVAMSGGGVHLLTVNNSSFNNNGDHGFELHSAPVNSQFFGFFNNNSFLGNMGTEDFLAQIDAGPNPPLHAGTLVCLSFTQNVASSNYLLQNNADPVNVPEFGTIQFEDDGTNVPGFTAAGPGPVVGVPFGTCAVGAAPFRILPP